MTDQIIREDLELKMPIVIRQAEKSDISKLEWYGQFRHFRFVFRKAYREQQAGRRIILIAACQGFPIGRLFIQLNSRNLLIADGIHRGYLYSFQVMEMFQRQGIGGRLIEIAEAILLQRHYRTVTIAVAKENSGALRLYERYGYEIFGEDAGEWQYHDHRRQIRQVNEPCWLLSKSIGIRNNGKWLMS